MKNSISIYNFNQNQIRTAYIDGQFWFCLADARAALSINGSLKKGCTFLGDGVNKIYLTDKLGRKQETSFINEPNLYRLIFRSNKPQAQAFADWVYSEVLPSIRKTGSYGMDVSKKEIPTLPTPDADLKDWCAQALALMVENRVRMAVDEERKQILNQMKNLLDKG